MLAMFRIAAAFELLLTAAKECFHVNELPLGGGHLQQIGIAFVAAFVAIEIHATWHILWITLKSRWQRTRTAHKAA